MKDKLRVVSAVLHLLGGMFCLAVCNFEWFGVEGSGVDTALIIAFVLLGVGSVLTFMPESKK